MTKTNLYGSCMAPVWHLRPARRPTRGGPCGGAPTGSGFRHNFSKNCPRDLTMHSLERRPSRFSTICTKIQVLKINIDKCVSTGQVLVQVHVILTCGFLTCRILTCGIFGTSKFGYGCTRVVHYICRG